jgi:hypothetical protein
MVLCDLDNFIEGTGDVISLQLVILLRPMQVQ